MCDLLKVDSLKLGSYIANNYNNNNSMCAVVSLVVIAVRIECILS